MNKLGSPWKFKAGLIFENQCISPYRQTEGEKKKNPQMTISIETEKNIWQNIMSSPYKNSQAILQRGKLPHPDKRHLILKLTKTQSLTKY